MQQGVFCSSSNQSELRLVPATPLASNGVVMGPTVAGAGANGMQTVQGVQMQQGANGFFQGAAQGDNPFADATVNANGQQVFINPFSGQPEVMQQLSPEEQMQRDQRQQLRAARLRAFGQSQIEDEAIPPGMQRVRTPFGDRLMPVRE
jgi:hypothetical protein